MRNDVMREHFLRLDLDAARIDRDGDLGQAYAQFLHRLDPLDHVGRRADPDDVIS